MRRSDFTQKFVGTKIFTDATSNLTYYAESNQMNECKKQFEENIRIRITAASKTANTCCDNHINSEEWIDMNFKCAYHPLSRFTNRHKCLTYKQT